MEYTLEKLDAHAKKFVPEYHTIMLCSSTEGFEEYVLYVTDVNDIAIHVKSGSTIAAVVKLMVDQINSTHKALQEASLQIRTESAEAQCHVSRHNNGEENWKVTHSYFKSNGANTVRIYDCSNEESAIILAAHLNRYIGEE